MADFTRCIAAIKSAAGRDLTDDEIVSIIQRVQRTAKDIKAGRVEATGNANLSTPDGLMQHAAELEAKKLIVEAELKARRAVADAQTVATRQAEMRAVQAAGLSPVESVRRMLVNHPDGRADQFSLEHRYMGISTELKRKIVDTWDALGPGMFDYLQRPEMVKRLVSEMRGIDTGDALAKKGAQAWLKTAEEARQWFNDKGGSVGHLEDWGLPQHHSQDLVARAALVEAHAQSQGLSGVASGVRDYLTGYVPQRAENQRAWVDFVMPLIDRNRYTDLAGNRMSDADVREFLGHAWETIATGGANKIEPGAPKGKGARANRHAEERQIHFKDADALMAYWERFGDKTLPDILMGHLDSMAKDIAFVEHFGSNPNATYRMLRDAAEVQMKTEAPQSLGKIDRSLASLDRLYEYAAGITKPVADQRVADTFRVLHNLNTAGKLGSAMWASLIGDKVMFEAIGRVNNLPEFQLWHNEIRMLNPANAGERRLLRRNGLMLDYMTNAIARFGDDVGKSGLTDKLASGVMQVSGMSAVNEWRRGAWALSAMDTLGHMVSTKNFGQVSANDMRMLGNYGISDADWKVWKLAPLEDLGHGNNTGLTPEAIARIPDADLRAAGFDNPREARRDATVKLLGAITAESHIAVIEPGWSERALMSGGLQRGNVRDEFTRSFWQFKAFPFTQFERMIQLGMSRPTVTGKVAFLTTLPVIMTLAGAALIQVQQLLAGKDPQPMGNWRFLGAAFLKGGSLGLYGDFLFSQSGTTRYGTGPLEAIAGPTIGAIGDMAAFVSQAPGLIAQGKEPNLAAKSINIGKGFIPGNNLWFTKAATDHMIFQNAQEFLNPGYLAGMRARTIREFGNDWWWAPGEMTPDRPPDLGTAFESGP